MAKSRSNQGILPQGRGPSRTARPTHGWPRTPRIHCPPARHTHTLEPSKQNISQKVEKSVIFLPPNPPTPGIKWTILNPFDPCKTVQKSFMNCYFVSGKMLFWSCLMVTLLARVPLPFMNCSFAFGMRLLWSFLTVRLLARVPHPLMNWSLVLGKTPLWSFLMVILLARVLHPFMICSFVLGKMLLWACLMVPLLARVPHPFMNCSFVLGKMSL